MIIQARLSAESSVIDMHAATHSLLPHASGAGAEVCAGVLGDPAGRHGGSRRHVDIIIKLRRGYFLIIVSSKVAEAQSAR